MRAIKSNLVVIVFSLGLFVIAIGAGGRSVFALDGNTLFKGPGRLREAATMTGWGHDPFTIVPPVPRIDIKKYTNGEDADLPTGPLVAVGSTVTWTYVVSNTGNISLGNITVSDNRPHVTPTYISGDTDNDAVLDLNEIWLYRATGIAVGGQYSNIGTTTGAPELSPSTVVTDSDPSHYFGTNQLPALIGDRVWHDRNGNGVQNTLEEGIAGVKVDLYRQDDSLVAAGTTQDDTLVATDTTDADGFYLFTELPAGAYYVVFSRPQGYNFTKYNVNNNSQEAVDSDPLVPFLEVSTFDGGEEVEEELALGEPLTYTLFYTNSDLNLSAVNVVISATVPEGTSFVGASSTPGWSCTDENEGGICSLSIPSLAANTSGSATFVVLIDENDSDVPALLILLVDLTQGTLAATQVITLGEEESNFTVDAGVVRTEAREQTIAPTEPTNLPPTEQPNADGFMFLPTVRSEE